MNPREVPDAATVPPVSPKQSRPSKVSKSLRLREPLLARVEAVCDREGWSFSEAVERALEEWVEKREG